MSSKEMEPTHKTTPQSFSSLPEEIKENILARVSRWSYPSLSLVSRSFRSLLSPTQIYKTRSQLKAQETCVYVCIKLQNHPHQSWFSLWTKPPNQTLTKKRGKMRFNHDPNGTSVVPTPFASSDYPSISNNAVVVGSEIYVIGGTPNKPSSSVKILDFRSHTWRDAPSMTVAREDACAILLDGKIYVMGGCDIDDHSASWFEVLDTKTQSWTSLPGPGANDESLHSHLRENYTYNIVDLFEGMLYVATDEMDYGYNTKDGTWRVVREDSSFLPESGGMFWYGLDNVIYGCDDSGRLMWSDSDFVSKGREWREIKGLEKLREHRTRGLKVGKVLDLDYYDEKLLVVWDPFYHDSVVVERNEIKIWYAKIGFESSGSGDEREVWGKVECVDVLTFPGESYEFFGCFAISV